MPQPLTCPNGLTVPAADVISDFRQTTPIMYQTTTRGGTLWYSYSADTASDPSTAGNTFAIDAATSGPCNSGGSLKVSSPGNTGYGVGFGVNFRTDMPANKKQLYNASAENYTGVGFWMKCSADVEFVFYKVPDAANDADINNPTCTYTTAPICNQYGSKNNVVLANTWQYFEEYFPELLQDWDSSTYGSGIDATKLTAFQVQVNTKYTRDGSTRTANPFTCWVDDVYFLKKAAPAKSAPGTTTSVSMGGKTFTIAPGGYFTSGNQIYDSKGAVHKFRGLARPSFEWDPAGFGITREDIQRMKAWGANVIRFPINQEFWLANGTKGQYSSIYQKYIDLAVQRTLQAGMDVILDLHWNSVGTGAAGQQMMATPSSIQFWQQVATKYKGDGRITFELYNEPHDLQASEWKNGKSNGMTDSWAGMQQLYDAVRGTGANNLVLVGGLDFAYNLGMVLPANALTGINIAYVTHPYSIKAGGGVGSAADAAYGNLAATYPIVATEFGQTNTSGATLACDANTYTSILNYFSSKGVASWTGWAWLVDPTQCGFPTLITSYSGATNAAGAVVKAAIPGP